MRALSIPTPIHYTKTMSVLDRIHPDTTGGKIFEAATRLFREHGYKKVTISDITAAAGVGKGTLYLYWPSKQDLMLALIAAEVIRILQETQDYLRLDPKNVRVSHLAPHFISLSAKHPFLLSMNEDPAIMGVLQQRPKSFEILSQTGFSTTLTALVIHLDTLGLLDSPLTYEEQVLVIHTFIIGFMEIHQKPQSLAIAMQMMKETIHPTNIQNGEYLSTTLKTLFEQNVSAPQETYAEATDWLINHLEDHIARLATVLYPADAQN